MTYRTLLAVLASEADVEPIVAAAGKLPGRDVHLLGCHGEASQFATFTAPVDVPDTTTMTMLYEQAEERMRAIGGAFTAAASGAGFSHEWRQMRTPTGDSAAASLHSARVADLALIRQPDRETESAATANVESLLFEGGCPVLMLPADGALAAPAQKVVIGWDGSREASRAVRDALPFLKAATTTGILIVDPEKIAGSDTGEPGSDLIASLARHGVHADVHTTGRDGRSTAEAIEAHVRETGADLLVMGGYTHLRVREWLFGGVTHAFMNRIPVATLISR